MTTTKHTIHYLSIYIVGLLYISNMDKKKSKIVALNLFESKKTGKKQYRVTITPKFIQSLGWKAKDKLKVWVNKEKRQTRINKS